MTLEGKVVFSLPACLVLRNCLPSGRPLYQAHILTAPRSQGLISAPDCSPRSSSSTGTRSSPRFGVPLSESKSVRFWDLQSGFGSVWCMAGPGSLRFGAWQVRARFGLVHGRSGFGSGWCMAGLGSVRFCRPRGWGRLGFSALKLGAGPILIPKSNHEARGSGMGRATRMRRG